MNQLFLDIGDDHVKEADGDAGKRAVVVAHGFDVVEHIGAGRQAVAVDAAVDNLAELFFADEEVTFELAAIFRQTAVDITEILRDYAVKDEAAERAFHKLMLFDTVLFVLDSDLDAGVQIELMLGVGHDRFIDIHKAAAIALFIVHVDSEEVAAENHILSRHGDRFTVLRFQQVVGGKHEETGFGLGFHGKGNVHGHLVAVKVGVKGRAGQGVQFDGAAFDEHWLKGLNA